MAFWLHQPGQLGCPLPAALALPGVNTFLALLCLVGYLIALGVIVGGLVLAGDRWGAHRRRERELARSCGEAGQLAHETSDAPHGASAHQPA